MRRGVVTLRIKQYGDYRISVLNDMQDFMQIMLTNSDPALYVMTRRVTILRIKQYEEYPLSAIHNGGESIINLEYLIQFEAKFEKSLNTEKCAWEEFICYQIPGKKSRWTVPLILFDSF
jgi:hypothetical protein